MLGDDLREFQKAMTELDVPPGIRLGFQALIGTSAGLTGLMFPAWLLLTSPNFRLALIVYLVLMGAIVLALVFASLRLIMTGTDQFAPSEKDHLEAMRLVRSYGYALAGLMLGFIFLAAGSALCLKGVLGSSSFSAEVLGGKFQMNDAAPGVVALVLGVLAIWLTRPTSSRS